MSEKPLVSNEPEAESDPVLEALETARAARRVVGDKKSSDEDESSVESLLSEDTQKQQERARIIREAEASEYDRLLEIEMDKAPSTEIARKQLERRGIRPPSEPEDPEEVAKAEDAEARQKARAQRPQDKAKTKQPHPKRVDRPSRNFRIYDRDKNVEDFHEPFQ